MRSSAITHPGPTGSVPAYWIGRLWMNVFGWDVEEPGPQVPKGIIIATPHTSNWDLPHMLAAAFVYRIEVKWLGKHTLFQGPFGWFFTWLGGVPVDRTAPKGLVGQVADRLTEASKLLIAVPPSGTREKRDAWKSGFYWIAHTAQVPVICGYLDYTRRRANLGYTFVPTGDVKADMDKVRAFYEGVEGKFPELHTEIRLKEEDDPSRLPDAAKRAEAEPQSE
ncbi:MAG: 1-acyl-sn-glycerol-3-phosphate acyltransferase [Myxococcota bacterium]